MHENKLFLVFEARCPLLQFLIRSFDKMIFFRSETAVYDTETNESGNQSETFTKYGTIQL